MIKVTRYPPVPEDYRYQIQVKLSWYKLHGKRCVGEERLNFLSLRDLQNIFDVYINDAVLNYWHVKTHHARVLQKMTQHQITLSKFIYFIEQEGHIREIGTQSKQWG